MLKNLINETTPDDSDKGCQISVSAGTHAIIFAWVPPTGIPDAILEKLYDRLLEVVTDPRGTQSRQSSGAGSELEGRIEFYVAPSGETVKKIVRFQHYQ
jgi:hypothetical protein